MLFSYRPHSLYDNPIDMDNCRASVANGGRSVGFHQCMRKGYIEEEEKLWCKTHAPSTMAAKRQTANEKYQEETIRWKCRVAMDEARGNLVKIAVMFINHECSHDELERVVKEYEGLEK